MNYKAQVVFSNDDLTHFGVKGMKWGVRKDRETLGKRANKSQQSDNRAKLKKALKVAAVGAIAAGATYAAIKYSQNSQNGRKPSSTSSRERQPLDDWSQNPDKSLADIARETAKSNPKYIEDWENKRKELDKKYADTIARNEKLRKQYPTFETKEELQSWTNEVLRGNQNVKIKRYGETDNFYDPLASTKAKTYIYDATKMTNNQKYKRIANVAKGIEKSINEDVRKKGAGYVKSPEYAQRTKMLDDFYKLLDNV